MIAATPVIGGGPDRPARQSSSVFGKEEMYALRRVLVRRLQEATRGIARRERAAARRRFAETWREAVSAGTLPGLAASARGDTPAETPWGILGQLACGQPIVNHLPAVSPKSGTDGPPSVTIPGVDSLSPAERTVRSPGSRPGAERKQPQVELFGSALVVQPL